MSENEKVNTPETGRIDQLLDNIADDMVHLTQFPEEKTTNTQNESGTQIIKKISWIEQNIGTIDPKASILSKSCDYLAQKYFDWHLDMYWRPSYWFDVLVLYFKMFLIAWYGREKKWQHFTIGFLSISYVWNHLLKKNFLKIKSKFRLNPKEIRSQVIFLQGKLILIIKDSMARMLESFKPENFKQTLNVVTDRLQYLDQKYSKQLKILKIVVPIVSFFGIFGGIIYYLFFSASAIKPILSSNERSLVYIRSELEPPIKEFLVEYLGIIATLKSIENGTKKTNLVSIDIIVETTNKKTVKELKERSIEFKSDLGEIISSLTREYLLSEAAKESIKEKFMLHFESKLKHKGIRAVFFKNYVVN